MHRGNGGVGNIYTVLLFFISLRVSFADLVIVKIPTIGSPALTGISEIIVC